MGNALRRARDMFKEEVAKITRRQEEFEATQLAKQEAVLNEVRDRVDIQFSQEISKR